jgi:hypothetical protein
LIIEMMPLRLMSHAGMGERFRQQERVAELVINAVFERVHLEGASYAPKTIFPEQGRR